MKIEKTIGDFLRRNRWTLSVAESCTGGLICDWITNVPGSSHYFMGGMVNYSNESKAKHLGVPMEDIKKHGAVSPQVARKMAQGVRKTFGTTFGLSSTGIAGPTGGTREKPVGLVFIGVAKGRRSMVMKLNLKGGRIKIKQESAHLALKYLHDLIKMEIERKRR